jgi:hypothetical protein
LLAHCDGVDSHTEGVDSQMEGVDSYTKKVDSHTEGADSHIKGRRRGMICHFYRGSAISCWVAVNGALLDLFSLLL